MVVVEISKKIDMTGKRSGSLTVLEMLYNYNGTGTTKCRCLCDCGNEVIKISSDLRSGKITSCGCKTNKHVNSYNVIGKRFGKLTVLESIWSNECSNKNKLKCLCDCGNIIILRRGDVLSGHTKSCGCYQRQRAKDARYRNYANFISDFDVKIIQPYKRNKKNQLLWECECPICKNHFYELPSRIKDGHVRSCGCLNASSMENLISKILKENNATFESQYTFDDLRSNSNYKLRFDFALIKFGKVYYLLEYDGEQHYHSVEHFGGEIGFRTRRQYDDKKNKYCSKNNIPLLRIPYYWSIDKIKNEIVNII